MARCQRWEVKRQMPGVVAALRPQDSISLADWRCATGLTRASPARSAHQAGCRDPSGDGLLPKLKDGGARGHGLESDCLSTDR